MLKHIYIRNFVLIDELEVTFDSGLSVITGETGAGKSILFGALALLKGKRADLSELKDPSSKSIIEARIDVSKYKLRNQFEAENLDYQEEAIFRREISPQGKSRAFINDTPVRLEQMQVLGDLLFDIHSQHQSIQLNEGAFRLQIIDELSDSKQELFNYQAAFKQYKETEEKTNYLREQSRTAIQEEDYLQFQFDELNNLNLQVGEENELENEHALLANGEQLMTIAEYLAEIFQSEESATLTNLHIAVQKLEELASLYPAMKELSVRFKSSYLEISDIASEIDNFKDNFDLDTHRLQFIEERMAEIHRLKFKHGLESADQLLELKDELERKLLSISNYEEEIKSSERKLKELAEILASSADQLSEKRRSYFTQFKESVESTLKKIGIPDAQFTVEHEKIALTANGYDRVDFLFSANIGQEMQAVRKVASGGELSRIMLAIKRELAAKKQMPALFFDEIDTGVSGEVANQLGRILKEMGDSHQILSITHLPQLAAKGRAHYYIFKSADEIGNTRTFVRRLLESERVEALAKMLSGERVSEAAMNNARELLAQ